MTAHRTAGSAGGLTGDDIAGLTLPQILALRAARHPRALALREKRRGIWRRISWEAYDGRVRALALGLHALGLAAGDRMAVAAENAPDWLCADLAAQTLGAVSLGLYPTSPVAEIQAALHLADVRLVVCGDQEQVDKLLEAMTLPGGLPALRHIVALDMKGMRHYRCPLLIGVAELLARGERSGEQGRAAVDGALAAGRPDDPAVLVLTAGVEGRPKAVALSHSNLLAAARGFVTTLQDARAGVSYLSFLPLAQVLERSLAQVVQLVAGTTVSFSESVDTAATDLREIGPTLFFGLPRIWERLRQDLLARTRNATPIKRWVITRALAHAEAIRRRTGNGLGRPADRLVNGLLDALVFRFLRDAIGLGRASACLCGGAPVADEVLHFFWTIGLPVHQVYGLAEAGGITHRQDGGTGRSGIGRALPGIEDRLSAEGELLLRGPAVFDGYVGQPEEDARALADGWLHTGDLGERAGDGTVRLLGTLAGRATAGAGGRVAVNVVENAMKGSLYIREAVVVGGGRPFLTALVQIDVAGVGAWAQGRGLSYTSYRSLAERPEVRSLLEQEIARILERLPHRCDLGRIVILDKELDQEKGEVTATMKVRRSVVELNFSHTIDRIYEGA